MQRVHDRLFPVQAAANYAATIARILTDEHAAEAHAGVPDPAGCQPCFVLKMLQDSIPVHTEAVAACLEVFCGIPRQAPV